MFTGIIKEMGRVAGISRMGKLYRLSVESKDVYKDMLIGSSVSVSGVCLTVTGKNKNILSFDVMEETVCNTNLSCLRDGDAINLEAPLKAGEAFGGHFVLGHIDTIGKITELIKQEKSASAEIAIPREFSVLMVEKGSIAIDGVSLTIRAIHDNKFKVHIIPHTLHTTTLISKKPGDILNVEFDIIGKYIVKSAAAHPRITEDFLKEKGF